MWLFPCENWTPNFPKAKWRNTEVAAYRGEALEEVEKWGPESTVGRTFAVHIAHAYSIPGSLCSP